MDVQRPRASQALGPLVPAGRQAAGQRTWALVETAVGHRGGLRLDEGPLC